MRDNQFRLLWNGISKSQKIRSVQGDDRFRLGCHLVYTWLLPWCDDDGRMPGEPLTILANVVPHEGISLPDIEKILLELDRVELIRWYSSNGDKFIQIINWKEHQRIRKDRYKASIYPEWKPCDKQMETTCPQICDLSPSQSASPSATPTKKEKEYIPVSEESPVAQKPLSKSKPIPYSEEFLSFWAEYPARRDRKVGKAEAFREWKKLSPDPELIQKIMTSLKTEKENREAAIGADKFFADPPDAFRWLKNRRWEDEVFQEKKSRWED